MSIICFFIFSTIAHPLRQIAILMSMYLGLYFYVSFFGFGSCPFTNICGGPFWMCFVLTGRHTNGDERSASRRKHLQRSQHIGLSDSKSACCVYLVCDEGTSRKACYYFKEVKNGSFAPFKISPAVTFSFARGICCSGKIFFHETVTYSA